MKIINYNDSNRTQIVIMEPKDDIDTFRINIRGHHSDLFCIPIEYIENLELYQYIKPNISDGSLFWGGIFYYTNLGQLKYLLKPKTFKLQPIYITDEWN